LNFSSAEYPVFLIAVFFLYFGLRVERGVIAWARLLFLLLLGDLVYLVLSRNLDSLWDPFGAIVLGLISPGNTEVDPALSVSVAWLICKYLIGTGVFVGSVFLGAARWDWLSAERGQKVIGFGMVALLGVMGLLILGFSLAGSIDSLSGFFATTGHLFYLFLLGIAFGASRFEEGRMVSRLIILFLVSCIFYHVFSSAQLGAYKYLLLIILGTIALDYYLALWIDATQDPVKRKTLLIVSLVSNLGILSLFKYFDFFTGTFASAFHAVGLNFEITPIKLILPAGISFHTFQSLSYTIDVYKKEIKPTKSIIEFATFVLLFPQLIAGPIVRAHEFMPQLSREPFLDAQKTSAGIFRIMIGLIKKIALADALGNYLVNNALGYAPRYSGLEVLFAVYGYAFQIYLDFSAYSDIAIGSAMLLGFEFPENFKTPYRSGDIQEFWRRWHITLSSWLRDYLYIALGGSRGASWLTYRNLALTMLLGGLWHGANWAFIVWGALHGGGLAVTRVWQRLYERKPDKVKQLIPTILMGCLNGLLLHVYVFRVSINHLGETLEVNPAWVHLILAWCYVTPVWALLTALLTVGKPPLPPEVKEERFDKSDVSIEPRELPDNGKKSWELDFKESQFERLQRVRETFGLVPAAAVLACVGIWGLGYWMAWFWLEMLGIISATISGVIGATALPFNGQNGPLAPWLAPFRAIFIGAGLLMLRLLPLLSFWSWLPFLILWMLSAVACSVAQSNPNLETAIDYTRWSFRKFLGMILTFHYACFAWIFFWTGIEADGVARMGGEANPFGRALEIIYQIGTFTFDSSSITDSFLCTLSLALAVHFFPENTFRWLRRAFHSLPPFARALVIFMIVLILRDAAAEKPVQFIYHQF
jgi:alginate O-acetyltransferase complex protein AlgI